MKKENLSTLLVLLMLTLLWLFFNRGQGQWFFYLIDLPYFILFTGLLFSLGLPSISQGIRYGTKKSISKTLIVPVVLLVLYYLYAALNGQPVMEGASLLMPYLVLFPVLALFHQSPKYNTVTWWDLGVLLLLLWPVTLVDLPERTSLPIEGVHFDSVYRMMIMMVTVYAFVVVRRLPGVGFWIDLSWRKLWTTLWVWALYIGLILVLGFYLEFMVYEGFGSNHEGNWERILIRFLSIYLHTALFEELFFRGLLQNMLARKIRQSANPLIFWIAGFVVLTLLALLTGVSMKDGLVWFPMMITVLLLVGAYLLSNMFKGYQHHYLAMAITSVVFGLVHFHAGSVIFVGFAILAGWAYGYVYWKTRNVLYAALIHTLVNISPLLFGLDLLK